MSDLSDKVTALTVVYLGPAAKIFLTRQTNRHMNGLPFEALDRKHLPELCKWMGISAGLIIGPDKAKELADKVAKL